MILIVSFTDNEHVERVRALLDVESVIVDQAWFPASMSLDARLSDDFESLRLALPDGGQIVLGEVGAVWNRRIRPYLLHQELTDPTARMFAWSESNEAMLGAWATLKCFWMNPPASDEAAQRKIRQLQIARGLGLTIPETLITNDPRVARDFIRLYGIGNVVRKAFRNIAEAPRETSLVTDGDLALIDSVRFAPVIFQRFVPVARDLRVTIVEDEVFSTSFVSKPEHEADYRIGLDSAEVAAYELPDPVRAKLLGVMESLGLRYGAMDLRVTPDGDHVFLEVNPAGEYLFVAERTGQPIAEAIASSLERHDREHQRKIARG